MGGTTGEIGEVARRLLERPGDVGAQRALVGYLLDLIEGEIRRAIRGIEQDNARLELANTFFDRRLVDPKFLKGLAKADSAAPYVREAVRNFIADQRRGAFGTRMGAEVPSPDDDHEAPEDEEEDDPVLASGMMERFGRLSKEEQVLCLLVHGLVTPWLVATLASQRGVPPELVREELTARGRALDGEEARLQDELDRRGMQIQRLQYRMAAVRGDLGRRAPEATEVVTPSSDLVERLATPAGRQRASRAELKAYEHYLVGRVEMLQKLQSEARRKLHDPETRRRRWDDVLALLGELPTDPAERKRSVNRVTKQYKRLIVKIRGEAS